MGDGAGQIVKVQVPLVWQGPGFQQINIRSRHAPGFQATQDSQRSQQQWTIHADNCNTVGVAFFANCGGSAGIMRGGDK